MVKNYQKIMDDEYVNAVLKNIQMRVKLQNLKAEPMNEYDNGIEPRQTMEQTLNRTEFLNNTMAQRQKMDENLFKLFQDDEVSINIVYDNITQSDEDVLFFNSNFNKLYIIDLDYLDANYFIAFYERYKQKYSDPKNIIVDENLKKLDEEQFNQEVEDAKEYYDQNFSSSYQNPNNDDVVNESKQVQEGEAEYVEEVENVNNQTNNDEYIKEQIRQDKQIIDILSSKITYKKYGDFIGLMCHDLLMMFEFFLTNETDILGEPIVNKKEAEKNLYKLFSKLKMLFKYRYNKQKKLKYVNEIQPYIEYQIVNFDVSKLKYRNIFIRYDDLQSQTWAQTDDEGIENFMAYIALAINQLIKIDYQSLNEQHAQQVQNRIEELRIQEEEAREKERIKREKERIKKEKELQDIKDAQESIIEELKRNNTKREQKRLEQEQLRLEQERIQLEEQMRLDRERREQRENEALGKVEKFSKIFKEKNKLKKQKEAEEERIRLEQERLQAEQDEADYEQLFINNPHGYSNNDVITDGVNNFKVDKNDAYKINPKSGSTSEKVKIEYVVSSDNTFFWVNKSGKKVSVSLVQSASITPTATKSQWPFNFDIPEDGENFRRYGDYLFRIDPTTRKLNEYPKYLIEPDDSITELTKTSLDYTNGHNEHKQDIQDYNATLGAGLKRNIGVSKILKSLGYEII
jgi:hypothetical protein